MDSKWQCVVFVMTVLLFVNYALAQDVPSSCPKPENAVQVKLNQIFGVWHYQAMAVEGTPNNDVACSRIEFVKTGQRKAFVSGYQYYKSTGNSSHSYGPVRVLKNQVIVTDSIDIPSTKFYSYPLMVTDDVLIYTTCVVGNDQVNSKNVAVLTRKISVDRKYVDDLLAKVNVTNMNVGYADNYDECFTLTCHRKSD